jgi:hypothetical protein
MAEAVNAVAVAVAPIPTLPVGITAQELTIIDTSVVDSLARPPAEQAAHFNAAMVHLTPSHVITKIAMNECMNRLI